MEMITGRICCASICWPKNTDVVTRDRWTCWVSVVIVISSNRGLDSIWETLDSFPRQSYIVHEGIVVGTGDDSWKLAGTSGAECGARDFEWNDRCVRRRPHPLWAEVP